MLIQRRGEDEASVMFASKNLSPAEELRYGGQGTTGSCVRSQQVSTVIVGAATDNASLVWLMSAGFGRTDSEVGPAP